MGTSLFGIMMLEAELQLMKSVQMCSYHQKQSRVERKGDSMLYRPIFSICNCKVSGRFRLRRGTLNRYINHFIASTDILFCFLVTEINKYFLFATSRPLSFVHSLLIVIPQPQQNYCHSILYPAELLSPLCIQCSSHSFNVVHNLALSHCCCIQCLRQ